VDEFRLKPSGMSMCKGCGMVSYPAKYKTPEEIKRYYLKEYRKNTAPSVMNLYTGQRKLHYHAHFLKELIDQWKKDGFETPVICEVGAAFGMALNWFKKQCFPNATILGTEWDLNMRRNCWHEWKIKLDEDFDPTRKYDLIMSYKVAEHMLDADQRLRDYATSLSDNGRLYISVPIWFGSLNNFGKQGFDLEYYYHPDHINVWSKKLFESVLKKAGLEVIKFNDTFYDSTYLCKRNDALMSEPREFENPEDILAKLDKIFKANQAGMDGDYDKAVEIYPNFPYAWEGRYEKNRAKIHEKGFKFIFDNYLQAAIDACPSSAEVRVVVADICMRYEKYQEATKFLDLSLKMKPENPDAIKRLMMCFTELGNRTTDQEQKVAYFKEARNVARYLRDISKQDEPEAISWIYNHNARIEMPHEQADATPDSPRGTRTETLPRHQGEVDLGRRAEP
jgi:SAM-dependent methyltransferase